MLKLPKFLKPFFVKNKRLIRIGSEFDGSYVVLKDSILATENLITYEISDNFDFEKHFKSLSRCVLKSYDNSIDYKFWLKRFKIDLIKFFKFKIFKLKKILDIFKFIDFYIFYKKAGNSFYLKKIGNKKGCVSINKTINPDSNNNFFKIDIEGSEYDTLDYILKNQKKITGLVIEFHEIQKNIKNIKKFIISLKHLKLIHLHGNTYSQINQLGLPEVIECTFSNKKFLKNHKKKGRKKFPLQFLDKPNSKRHKQYSLI